MKYFEILQQYSPQEVEAEAPACLNDVAIIKDTVDGDILLRNTFANGSTKTIKAIAVTISMWDVFGEVVLFGDKEMMDYVYQDIVFEPQSIFGNTIPIKLPDNVRRVNVRITRVVLDDGIIWKTNKDHFVHTQPQDLIEGTDDFIVNISKGNEYPALFLYAENEECWQCTCGGVNLINTASCYRCGRSKDECALDYNSENMHQRLTLYKEEADRVAKEKAEKEREERLLKEKKEREEQERIRQEKRAAEAKQARKRYIIIGALVTVAIAVCIAFVIWRNVTFGLSKEDKAKYNVALKNYQTIDWLEVRRNNDYWPVVGSYFDYDNPLSSNYDEAFSNGEYLAVRALYLEVAPLYKQIKDQFPEKYQSVYSRLAKLKESAILSQVTRSENTNLGGNSYNKQYKEDNNAIEEEAERVSKYINDDLFNPDSVKEIEVPIYTKLKTTDYSYGETISYSILYHENGEIEYIGEIRDGKEYGIGTTYYSSEENNKESSNTGLAIKEEGLFVDGELVDGEIHSLEGEIEEVHNTKALEGYYEEFLKPSKRGSKSSSKPKGSETKAKSAAKEYLQMLVNKQSSIKTISFTGDSYSIGNDYYFGVSVDTTAGTRTGEVECNMKSDGSYSVSGLSYD